MDLTPCYNTLVMVIAERLAAILPVSRVRVRRSSAAIPLYIVLNIAIQVLNSLKNLHSKGYTHTYIKVSLKTKTIRKIMLIRVISQHSNCFPSQNRSLYFTFQLNRFRPYHPRPKRQEGGRGDGSSSGYPHQEADQRR